MCAFYESPDTPEINKLLWLVGEKQYFYALHTLQQNGKRDFTFRLNCVNPIITGQMASTPTAPRLQNKSQKDHIGILKQQELNKITTNSRVKLNTNVTQFPKRGAENKNPNESTKPAKGLNKLIGVSRLPVLAKSQQSAVKGISSDPAHRRWEERPLLGKAQKRKTCTKPVPFSLSQSRTHNQKGTDASSESADKFGELQTHLTRRTPAKTLSVSRPGTKTDASTHKATSKKEYTKHASGVVTNNASVSTEIHTTTEFKLNIPGIGNDLISAIQKDLSTKLGNITLAHTELAKDGRSSSKACGFKDQADCRPSTKQTIQSRVSAEREPGVSEGAGNAVASSQTPRVSKCPSGPDSNVYLRVSVKKKKAYGAEAISENTMPFSPDPSALRSILLNEGIKVRGPDGATPRVSTCPSAQRVPMRKPWTHTAASVGKAAGGAVTFSPDPSALQSIMLSEGVKQGAVRTPRGFPSARAPSVYSAHRVPVKKTPSETSTTVALSPDPSAILHNEGVKLASSDVTTPRVPLCPSRRATCTAQRVPMKKDRAGEAAHTGISQTPGRKWTPQRVPASQSHSVMKANSTHKTHIVNISPGFGETQDPSMARFPQQEEEVVQRLFQEEPEHERNEQMEDGVDEVTPGQSPQHQQSAEPESKHKGETELCLAEKEKLPAAQPFIQAPHRQSVIVFSSGQKLLPRNGGSIQTSQHAAQLQPSADQTSRSQSELSSESNRQVTPGKQCKAKASSLSLAVCALKRRLPPLEEMFLDEECAMYTSRQQSWPSQPRCLNPVASTLLFQDATRFVPIIVTAPILSPVPQLSSPIKV